MTEQELSFLEELTALSKKYLIVLDYDYLDESIMLVSVKEHSVDNGQYVLDGDLITWRVL